MLNLPGIYPALQKVRVFEVSSMSIIVAALHDEIFTRRSSENHVKLICVLIFLKQKTYFSAFFQVSK